MTLKKKKKSAKVEGLVTNNEKVVADSEPITQDIPKEESSVVFKDVLNETNETTEALLQREIVIAESNNLTRELYDKTRYGELNENKKFQYSLIEGLYLLERGKFKIKDGKKELSFDDYLKRARKIDPNFWVRYVVFKDLRKRGYIVKTALKFGADFRVYDRGVKPGEDHAKWIVFPVHEGETLTWYEFAAKNRVAHSTKKNLLLAIVDAEGDVTFYQVEWIRP